MKQIWTISKRELKSYFDSLMAYIIMIIFLGFTGFLTWVKGFGNSDIFFINQASLRVFFEVAYWTLFFFIPAMTMRLVAEENRVGTLELILTKPVSDWQFVVGKFVATLILIIISLGLTLPFYFTIWSIGPIDHGEVISGYIGLILISAAYISIGLFSSSITNNQIISFLVALLIGIFFHLLFRLLSEGTSGMVGKIFNYLNMRGHFDSISRGVIDTKDIIYFLSIISIGLFASEAALSKRNIVG